MARTWAITTNQHDGAGWLIAVNNDGDVQHLAFRTLDAARKHVASIVQVDKRVRFTKIDDATYTYAG